jgi:hypothetical protein
MRIDSVQLNKRFFEMLNRKFPNLYKVSYSRILNLQSKEVFNPAENLDDCFTLAIKMGLFARCKGVGQCTSEDDRMIWGVFPLTYTNPITIGETPNEAIIKAIDYYFGEIENEFKPT